MTKRATRELACQGPREARECEVITGSPFTVLQLVHSSIRRLVNSSALDDPVACTTILTGKLTASLMCVKCRRGERLPTNAAEATCTHVPICDMYSGCRDVTLTLTVGWWAAVNLKCANRVNETTRLREVDWRVVRQTVEAEENAMMR